jgi:hypothetical protein
MNRPPMLMHLRFYNRDRKFGLWLPLFLLIPVALVVLIILSPLILIAILVMKAATESLCSLRGLEVDVQNRNESIYISVV